MGFLTRVGVRVSVRIRHQLRIGFGVGRRATGDARVISRVRVRSLGALTIAAE